MNRRIFAAKRWIFAALGGLMLMGCTSRYDSPVLVDRGSTKQDAYEAEWLATKEGFGIDTRLKKVFQQGYIEEGMNQDMVNLLWGPPDRELDEGRVWEYLNHDTGALITRLKWKESETKRLDNTELVLETIEGDRYGGSPAPTSTATSQY